jgi:hypothetical protein
MAKRKRGSTANVPEDPTERTAGWLEIIAKTLAVSRFQEDPETFKTVAARIEYLTGLGFTAKDIAALTGASGQVVANVQSAARRRGRRAR